MLDKENSESHARGDRMLVDAPAQPLQSLDSNTGAASSINGALISFLLKNSKKILNLRFPLPHSPLSTHMHHIVHLVVSEASSCFPPKRALSVCCIFKHTPTPLFI